MIKINVTPADLVDMRFAYSPLMELSTSFHMLQKPKLHTPYLRWIDETRVALNDVELPILNDLHDSQSYIPDFLTPTPCATDHTIEDDLNLVSDLPPEMIRNDIRTLIERSGETEIRHQFLAYPNEWKMQLIDELRLYWQRTLSHHWPRMSSILDGDVLYRARKLALDGVESLFSDLHPHLSYMAQQIIIDKPSCRYSCDLELSLDGQGLQLVPAVFAASKLYWQVTPDWQPMLIYSVRGAGLWRQEKPDEDQSLEIMLGVGRARILKVLSTPSNTGELARKLELTDGAISQHLNRLNQAGLVEPHRSGKRVYYHLTHRGEQLLALFEPIG
jgi:DNA-binding transcriptional ArsR family regulator